MYVPLCNDAAQTKKRHKQNRQKGTACTSINVYFMILFWSMLLLLLTKKRPVQHFFKQGQIISIDHFANKGYENLVFFPLFFNHYYLIRSICPVFFKCQKLGYSAPLLFTPLTNILTHWFNTLTERNPVCWHKYIR